MLDAFLMRFPSDLRLKSFSDVYACHASTLTDVRVTGVECNKLKKKYCL